MDAQKKKAFTLIELLVVISIIALLLSVLLPALRKAKTQAQSVVCRSNLKQWGVVVSTYLVDNKDTFWGANRNDADNYWPEVLQPYTGQMPDFRFCPAASTRKQDNPTSPVSHLSGATYSAWDIDPYDENQLIGHTNGSYGLNEWVIDPKAQEGTLNRWGFPLEDFWVKSTAIKTPYAVPLFADALWFGSYPQDTNAPPTQPDEWENSTPNSMKRHCIDRHNKYVNAVFADGTARNVGLKELWTLKWHRSYNTAGEWTLAGGATQDRWNNAAPWMSKYPLY